MSDSNDNLEKILESKFYCPQKFAQEIEKIVSENKDMRYMEAIVFFCEKNSIEIESVPKLMSKPLKERLKAEAMELNMLKKTSRAKLPL
jgi:hypothetical protein